MLRFCNKLWNVVSYAEGVQEKAAGVVEEVSEQIASQHHMVRYARFGCLNQ